MPSPTDSTGAHATTYDLVLLLDTEAAQDARAGVVKEVKSSISADGELLRHDQWGNRELAYPIRHRSQAEYHLLQFHPAKVDLLQGLDRSLSIADEVLRFRIVKLRPGTPEPPDMRGAPPPSEPRVASEPAAEPPAAAEDRSVDEPAADEPAAEASAPVHESNASETASAPAGDAAATEEPAGEGEGSAGSESG